MAETLYDEVPYPSAVYSQTHPDRLAMHATLRGMSPAPVEKCRVLELGCGDGWNLIAMAHGLPGSEFVGIDLAETPVSRGNALASQIGLQNLSLRAMDVADAVELGEFDYIIAHGLYSWVPPHVREKVMELCGRSLAPQGVAYISYNAYPGNHARDLVRGMMRYHTAHFADVRQKIGQARGLVRFLADSKQPREVYHELLAQQVERMSKCSDAAFFHDDLGGINRPFYFHEFMADASARGLQFLAEADVADNRPREHPPHVQAVLSELDPADIVAGEQYLDFLRGRAFRQTLLCRADVRIEREILPGLLCGMHIAGDIRAASPAPELASRKSELFLGPKESEVETDHPLVKAVFAKLGALWPASRAFRALLTHSLEATGRAGETATAEETEELASALLQAHWAGFVEFHMHPARMVAEPGEKPRASALARVQLTQGDRASSLRHEIVEVRDPMGKALLRLMDGTRDRAALKAALDEISTDSEGAVSLARLDENLRKLARLALVVE